MRTSVRQLSVVLASAGLLFAVGCGSSAETSTATTSPPGSTTTRAPAATSPTATSPTATTAPSSAQPDTAVWPFASDSTRFSDPVNAATGFATTFLGFVNPVVGAFQKGDTRSGEVAIQPSVDGPITTVLVRQLPPDDSWWILGATTANLQPSSPKALSAISSPARVTGQSTAFEATIIVEARADGQARPLVSGPTMGGSNGDMGPFSISLTFPKPAAARGAIVVKTMSAKDGNIAEATVIRVRLR